MKLKLVNFTGEIDIPDEERAEQPPFPETVSVAEKEAEAAIFFRAPGAFKRDLDIYIATHQLTLKDFGVQVFREYMAAHP